MQQVTRRDFMKGSVAAGLAFGLSRAGRAGMPSPKAAGPNGEVRLAIVGLGGIDIPGSVGGRGRQLLDAFQSESNCITTGIGSGRTGLVK